jgi:hypothetical protein
MQKDQLQAEHTTPPSHNGHRASERPPCCHKESARASCLSLLARGPSKRHRCQLFVFGTSSAAQPEVQLTLPACRARKILQGQGRAALRQRQSSLDRLRAGDRRSDRSRRDAALDHGWITIDAGDATAYRTQAPLHRCVVSRIARSNIPPILCGASPQIPLNRTDRRYIDHVSPRRSVASNQASGRMGLGSRRYDVAMLRRLYCQ